MTDTPRESDAPQVPPAKPSAPLAPPAQPAGPGADAAKPAAELSPEEQMERFAQELKETDWGHQPC